MTDLVSRLTKELKQAKDNLAEERLVFQDKTIECKELRDQLDNALARENSYLARLAVYEDAGTDESKLRNALLALRESINACRRHIKCWYPNTKR